MCILFQEAKEKVKKRFAPTVVFRQRQKDFFPGCLLLLYFDFPSLFSGINISIIEPSWFRCYHRDDPSIPSAPHSLWQLPVCRDVNKFLLNKSLVTIGIFLSIFLKIFFCCWQQQTASTKKKILFFGRVNICHASNFLVLQETPEIFNQNWSDKREEGDETRKILLLLFAALKWKIGVIWEWEKSYHVSCYRRENNEQSLKAIICWLISSSFVIGYCFSWPNETVFYVPLNWREKKVIINKFSSPPQSQ